MAHIQVTRRGMQPAEYIRLRYGWLKRRRYDNMTPVSPVYYRDAVQTGDSAFRFYDEAARVIVPGDLIYTPDGSAFFEMQANVSCFPQGREVFLYFKTTSEVIVKANGQYAGGVDPNRQLVSVSRYADANGDLLIGMLGFNRSKPDDERNPETYAARGCRQIFDGIFLCIVNDEVLSLCYDLELFCDIMDSDAFPEDYRAHVTGVLSAALDLIDFDSFDPARVPLAAAYIEEKLYRDTTFCGSGRVALIAHSHLDLAYYWRQIHTVQKNLRTVLLQMRLMDRYGDFTYCHTQPYTYETLKACYPEVYAELRQKVADGRFEPVGAMYVEPDCNLPNAESLIRQCLYGQRFYAQEFGFTVDTCWLPDVFGNSWILPQILQKSGVKYFISNKMSTWNDTNRFPHNHFRWRGIDGSEVFACVPPTHFISWNAPSQPVLNWEAFQDKEMGAETLQMFGYGDGGSGATEEMVELMHRFFRLSVMPETRHVTAKQFLHENFSDGSDLAVWDGELYLEMHRGTFTTKAALKDLNRRLETLFYTAELLDALTIRQGAPDEELSAAYKTFLVQQFHDILPGSHIAPVFRDALNALEGVKKTLTDRIPEGEDLFNPLNFPRDGIEFLPDCEGAFTRDGVKGNYYRVTAPSLGVCSVQLPDEDGRWLLHDGDTWETPFYRIVFDADGSFRSLYDKQLRREWTKGGLNRLRLYDDKPGVYDAWDIAADYDKKERPLTLETPLHLEKCFAGTAEFSVTQRTENSAITRRIRLFRDSREIETQVEADWQESHKLLKAEFSADILTREVVCDTSAGYIRRPTHRNTSWEAARYECCTHKWFDIGETGGGLAVINENKYGVGVSGGRVTLSLLRATERPDPLSDRGRHVFCYLLLPHAGSFPDAGVSRRALLYNVPPVRTAAPTVPGIFTAFSPLVLQAVKRAEDGSGLILRFCELDGARGTLELPQPVEVTDLLERPQTRTDRICYRPFEIVTVKTGFSG